MDSPSVIQCPVCNKYFPRKKINIHVNSCLGDSEENAITNVEVKKTSIKRKSESPPSSKGDAWAFMMCGNGRAKKSKHSLLETLDNETVIIEDSPDERKMDDVQITSKSSSETSSSRDNSEDVLQTFKPLKDEQASQSKRMIKLEELKVPLAEYMRPHSLESYLGQEKAVGPNSILGSLLHSKQIPSVILWGPPGCGKTTLAKIIAERCKSKVVFKKLSAVNSGVKDVNETVKQAKNDKKMFNKGTVLFLDEIHRFNKAQQDSLLPHIEDGTIVLIGATTENPSFQVNNALLSRCKVIVLEKLDCDAIMKILINATEKLGYLVNDGEKEPVTDMRVCYSSRHPVQITKTALEFLAQMCDGDARIALNGLQMAVQTQISSQSQSDSRCQKGASRDTALKIIDITLEQVKKSLQKTHIAYDKSGEEHYNILSAFHKSIRGSADSAALYWMARMLEGGESPITVARRMVACATEDIGIADPQALILAISTFQTCQFLGMPECEKALAECAVYLARAPKSIEVYQAYNKAKACVWEHEGPLPGVPLHLRNAPTKLMKNLGYGKGYSYYGKDQEFFPESLKGTNFFNKNR